MNQLRVRIVIVNFVRMIAVYHMIDFIHFFSLLKRAKVPKRDGILFVQILNLVNALIFFHLNNQFAVKRSQ